MLHQISSPRYVQSWQTPKHRCAPLAATVVSTWCRAWCIDTCSFASSASTAPTRTSNGSRASAFLPLLVSRRLTLRPSAFDRVIEEYAREPNGGLIILPSPNTLVHRRVIMAQAARHRLPAIYPYGFFAREGGLISYGIVPSDNFRRAAAYVDRILKGARPGELPVQVPTKFELVINPQDERGIP